MAASRRRPCLELLEHRCLPTAYIVTTTRDVLGDMVPGQVSLRDALTAIRIQAPSGNAAAGTASNTIQFEIGAPGSTQTINLTAALPVLNHPVFLDGWSQGGASYSGPPLIVLNGARAGSNAIGIALDPGSSNSTVRGLVLEHFGAAAIQLRGTSGDLIEGNYVGTNPSGTAYAGGPAGVEICQQATNNTIGGTTSGAGNVICANGPAVEIKDPGTTENVVLGNLIGTNRSGTAYLGALAGVEIRQQATDNTVGGTAKGAGNVISANGPGVEIKDHGTSGNTVLGNRIGTNRTGTAYLRILAGVEIRCQATDNTIGGTAPGSGNVIGGCNGPGVEIKDPGTSGNLVLGNLIGTNKYGTARLGNGAGVVIREQATGNTIGGTTAGSANVISGNRVGVEIKDIGTSHNVVLGNLIGTDRSGTLPLGNTTVGVRLRSGASSNTIGGTAPGSANIIAFNAKGIVIEDAATTGNSILGNHVWDNPYDGRDLAPYVS
jgi:titin